MLVVEMAEELDKASFGGWAYVKQGHYWAVRKGAWQEPWFAVPTNVLCPSLYDEIEKVKNKYDEYSNITYLLLQGEFNLYAIYAKLILKGYIPSAQIFRKQFLEEN